MTASVESSKTFLDPPLAILDRITPEGLERLADAARMDCITSSIRRAFASWYARESKTGTVTCLDDFAAVLGCNKSTVSRYLHGKIRKTDILQADLYLRKLGTSLKYELPQEEDIRFAIITATIISSMKARGLPEAEWRYIPPNEDLCDLMTQIIESTPLPLHAESDAVAWRQWLEKTVAWIYRRFPQATIEARPHSPWLTALMAGDWQVLREHLPWQTAAILATFFHVASDFTLRTNVPTPQDDVSTPSTADYPPVPISCVFQPRLDDANVVYERVDALGETRLSAIVQRLTTPLAIIAGIPRVDVLNEHGHERSEVRVFPSPDSRTHTEIQFWLQMEVDPTSEACIRSVHEAALRHCAEYIVLLTRKEVQSLSNDAVKTRIRIKHDRVIVSYNVRVSNERSITEVWNILEYCARIKESAAKSMAIFRYCSLESAWQQLHSTGEVIGFRFWRCPEGMEWLAQRAEFWTIYWGSELVDVPSLLRAMLPDDMFAGDEIANPVLIAYGLTGAVFDRAFAGEEECLRMSLGGTDERGRGERALRAQLRSFAIADRLSMPVAPIEASKGARDIIIGGYTCWLQSGEMFLCSLHILRALADSADGSALLGLMNMSSQELVERIDQELYAVKHKALGQFLDDELDSDSRWFQRSAQ